MTTDTEWDALDIRETVTRHAEDDRRRISVTELANGMEMQEFAVTSEEVLRVSEDTVPINAPIDPFVANEETLRLLYECLRDVFEQQHGRYIRSVRQVMEGLDDTAQHWESIGDQDQYNSITGAVADLEEVLRDDYVHDQPAGGSDE